MTDAPAGTRVAIVAPTAAGKSEVAMAVATAVPSAEIVAVDSMQVYAGMDIGTAKPTAANRAAVVHHGLDLVDPSARFTLADYLDATRPVMSGGTQPLVLVAGTGLYLNALLDGLEPPGEWPDIRAELERRADDDLGALARELADVDPTAARRIEPGNRRRIVRALEVCLGSGRPFSSFGPGLDRYPTSDVALVGLRWDRSALAERIARRVDQMIAAGLVDEVAALIELHGELSPTAGQALGYKEIVEHLRGGTTLDAAVERIVVRTRQFAVRQERWYRRDPRIHWIDVDADPVAAAAPSVTQALIVAQ